MHTGVSIAKRSWHLNIFFSLVINLFKDGLDLVPLMKGPWAVCSVEPHHRPVTHFTCIIDPIIMSGRSRSSEMYHRPHTHVRQLPHLFLLFFTSAVLAAGHFSSVSFSLFFLVAVSTCSPWSENTSLSSGVPNVSDSKGVACMRVCPKFVKNCRVITQLFVLIWDVNIICISISGVISAYPHRTNTAAHSG